jgi:hypothetical protein
MCWICRKLLHEDFAKETVAHQIMEQVLINVTDESSFNSESSEEENDWEMKEKKNEQQVRGIHLNLPTYIIQCTLPVKCDFGEMN